MFAAAPASSALASLKAKAQQQGQLLHSVRECLGSPVASAVQAVSYSEETLTLVLQSSAWASHLRLSAPTLAPKLGIACGKTVKRLQIRVRPGATPTEPSP